MATSPPAVAWWRQAISILPQTWSVMMDHVFPSRVAPCHGHNVGQDWTGDQILKCSLDTPRPDCVGGLTSQGPAKVQSQIKKTAGSRSDIRALCGDLIWQIPHDIVSRVMTDDSHKQVMTMVVVVGRARWVGQLCIMSQARTPAHSGHNLLLSPVNLINFALIWHLVCSLLLLCSVLSTLQAGN